MCRRAYCQWLHPFTYISSKQYWNLFVKCNDRIRIFILRTVTFCLWCGSVVIIIYWMIDRRSTRLQHNIVKNMRYGCDCVYCIVYGWAQHDESIIIVWFLYVRHTWKLYWFYSSYTAIGNRSNDQRTHYLLWHNISCVVMKIAFEFDCQIMCVSNDSEIFDCGDNWD